MLQLPIKHGDTFMSYESEFEVTLINNNMRRVTATKVSGINYPPQHEYINVDNRWYYVFYINVGQKRISMEYSRERNLN